MSSEQKLEGKTLQIPSEGSLDKISQVFKNFRDSEKLNTLRSVYNKDAQKEILEALEKADDDPDKLFNKAGFLWASLARIIAISNTDSACTAVLVHGEQERLYCANNSLTTEENTTARSNALTIELFSKFLLNYNDSNCQKELWEIIRKKSLQGVTKVFTSLAISTNFAEHKKKLKKFKEFIANLDHEKFYSQYSKQDSDLISKKDEIEKILVEYCKKSPNNKQRFSVFNATLILDDFINLSLDITKFQNSEKALLSKAWTAIKNNQFQFLVNLSKDGKYSHAEIALLQGIYDLKKENSELPELMLAGSWRKRANSPLVSSLWQCYQCWNIFDLGCKNYCGEKKLLDESAESNSKQRKILIGNLNVKGGALWIGSKPLFIIEDEESKKYQKSYDEIDTEEIEQFSEVKICSWNVLSDIFVRNIQQAVGT